MKKTRKRRHTKKLFMRTLLILTVSTVVVLVKFSSERAQYTDNAGTIAPVQQTNSIPGSPAPTPEPTEKPVDREKEFLKEQIKEISSLYKDIYTSAKKLPSPYFNDDEPYIGQNTIDEIETLLISNGCTLMNSDSVYPEYMENSQHFYSFWDSVKLGKNADAAFWGISGNGGLYYRRLRYHDGNSSCLNVSTKWNKNEELEIDSYEQRSIYNWLMAPSGDFIYQDLIVDRHWSASKLLRLRSVDRTLYDLNRRFIAPIGYRNVNIFLVDWDSSDFGEMCLNDVLFGLYYADFGVRLDTTVYPLMGDTGYHAIPAETFEKAVLHHFDISRSRLRSLAHYDTDSDTYPYNSYVVSYDSYYPDVVADVTDCTELGNGKIKLIVNVMCPDLHCANVFVHELTIRLLPDGDFQYLSNRVTFKETVEQPNSKPRITLER